VSSVMYVQEEYVLMQSVDVLSKCRVKWAFFFKKQWWWPSTIWLCRCMPIHCFLIKNVFTHCTHAISQQVRQIPVMKPTDKGK